MTRDVVDGRSEGTEAEASRQQVQDGSMAATAQGGREQVSKGMLDSMVGSASVEAGRRERFRRR